MHKKTAKIHSSNVKHPHKDARSRRMTIVEQSSSENGEIRSYGNGTSGSWDQQTDQSSWSEEILENTSSHRILEHWHVIEKTLYNEQDQLHPGTLFDECLQWRNQLPHLRIVGKEIFDSRRDCKRGTSVGKKSASAVRRRSPSAQRSKVDDGLVDFQRDLFLKDTSAHLPSQQNRRQAKEEVLDHIVNFICKELAEIEAEKATEDLSDNFDDYLKIAPAPTCTGKNPLTSNHIHYNAESLSSSNKDTRGKKESAKKRGRNKDSRTERNRLGTVFNERIIVSPVPFVVTTRESFSTIRKTPIQYIGEYDDTPRNSNTGSRRESSRRKLSVARKMPSISVPHVPSSWSTPVCPTVWPKNVKLTPIDTSRLPSSKQRPSKTADSVPNRNSLSPISRSVQPTSPQSCLGSENHYEGLEIRGSQFTSQTSQMNVKFRRKSIRATREIENRL